jgi:hypothetical protein
VFPPVRTLILSPHLWYSRTATPSATVGSLYDAVKYPLSALVDADTGPCCRFGTTSAGVSLALGATRNINVLGICNHNFDPGLLIEVYINGSKLPRTFSVQYPNCWIDLRAFADPTNADSMLSASTVEVRVYGNSQLVAMSEIVVGQAYRFDGTIELPFGETFRTAVARQRTDYKKSLEWGSGVVGRQTQLTLQVPVADFTALDTVTAYCGTLGVKAVVIPTTRRNDLWLVRWPLLPGTSFPNAALVTVSLELFEEPGGVLA